MKIAQQGGVIGPGPPHYALTAHLVGCPLPLLIGHSDFHAANFYQIGELTPRTFAIDSRTHNYTQIRPHRSLRLLTPSAYATVLY